MFTINLKYFKDPEGNYIIYNKVNSPETENKLVATQFAIKDILIPTNNSEKLESIFDTTAKELLNRQLNDLDLSSEQELANIRILGNFKDLDATNKVYQEKILDLSQIDKDNTYYRILLMSEITYTLTWKRFLKKPGLFIKSFFHTTFHTLAKTFSKN